MMFPTKKLGIRFQAVLLLAIYLAATLLPVQSASVETQAEMCGASALQSAHLTLQPASADEEVEVPKEAVDRAAYTANWRYVYKGVDAVLDIFTLSVLSEAIDRGHLPGAQIERVSEAYLKAVGDALNGQARKFTADDAAHVALNEALKVPELQKIVPKLINDLLRKSIFGQTSQPLHGSIAASSQNSGLGQIAQQAINEIVNRIYECAKQNPAVKKTVDKRNSSRTKSKIDDSAKQIANQNPDNPVLKELEKIITDNGSLKLSLNELRDMSKGEFAKLNDAIDGMQDDLIQIDQQQKDILQYLENAEAQAMVRAIKEANAAQYELTIQGLQSTSFILGTLADFIKPGMGKQLSTTLNSAISIADSMKKWLDAIDTMQGLDKLLNMSTVVMTGNVLSAVMNVVSLFGPSQPMPEQMILEEIGKLRQQVSQLRTEMHDRFDRIDQGLNSIYSTMQDRFDLIDIQLGRINGNIVEVQKSLVELDAKLSRMERNNFELISAVGRRDLVEAVNLGLGYDQRNGKSMPYTPDFDVFANKLFTWITFNAYDAGSVGPSQRDYSDAALLTELTAYPLDTNLSYLNGWLKSRGLAPISNKPLPSPRDWLFATRAYIQLGIEQPEHMETLAQRAPQRVAQIQSAALDVESAARNISTLTTLSGTVGNSLLFSTVITHYQGLLDNLDVSIQAQEAAYLQDVMGKAGIDRSEPFNLYGGIDQALSYQPAGLQALAQSESDEMLTIPGNMTPTLTTLNRYILGEYLRISPTVQIAVYMSASLKNPRQVPGCVPEPDVCPVIGDLNVDVRVLVGTVAILEKELQAGRTILPVIKGDLESPTAYVVRNWSNLKPRFEANATVIEPNPELAQRRAELFNFVTSANETRLALYQHSLYKRVFDAMSIGALRADAQKVAGSKLLLESFVSLGLSQAVESNDVMRAMLYGSQQIMGNVQIAETYAISATQPLTGTALLVNPRTLIAQLADKRTTAVNNMIQGYLSDISVQKHSESLEYLNVARRELDLTMRMVQITAPENPGQDAQRLFLPLVSR